MWRRRHWNLAGQIAGRGHLAHGRGDHSERAGDRSRDAVAQDRGREHRDAGDHEHRRVQRTQEREAVGARAQDDGLCRSGTLPERDTLRPVRVDIGRQRHGDRDVVVVVQYHLLRQAIVGQQGFQGPPSARGQCRRFDRAADAEGDLAVGQQAESCRCLAIQAEPDAERAENLRRIGGDDPHGHRDQLQNAAGMGHERARLVSADRPSHAGECFRRTGHRPFGQSCQHAAVPVGDDEEVGREPSLLVFLDDRPRRCWRRRRRPRP